MLFAHFKLRMSKYGLPCFIFKYSIIIVTVQKRDRVNKKWFLFCEKKVIISNNIQLIH